MRYLRFVREPIGGGGQSLREQADIEPQVSRVRVDGFLLSREQVHEQCTERPLFELTRDEAIPRAVTAAATAVRE